MIKILKPSKISSDTFAKMKEIILRPHHIPLIARIMKGNLDSSLMQNYFGEIMLQGCKKIVSEISSNPLVLVRIVDGQDSLCNICSLSHECESENIELIRQALGLSGRIKYKNAKELDDRVLSIYNKRYDDKNHLSYGIVIPAKELFTL